MSKENEFGYFEVSTEDFIKPGEIYFTRDETGNIETNADFLFMGAYVHYHGAPDGEPVLCQVEGFRIDDDGLLVDTDMYTDFATAFTGVRLSREILENLGFAHRQPMFDNFQGPYYVKSAVIVGYNGGAFYTGKGFQVGLSINSNVMHYVSGRWMHYLHELQLAYQSITGKPLSFPAPSTEDAQTVEGEDDNQKQDQP